MLGSSRKVSVLPLNDCHSKPWKVSTQQFESDNITNQEGRKPFSTKITFAPKKPTKFIAIIAASQYRNVMSKLYKNIKHEFPAAGAKTRSYM